ncbi:SH2 domain-containing protein 2A isoform X3 [Octodon degus]|uniref:SH2 domain-containing protein 2A isoform X3 n=1 Tax=Octodon degus TaxID=10160 RepID=A0A6P6EC71_OCTDE|nr:SH2 domain-containing protein 2A isoform X3 [Octodon degus]
MEMPLAQVGRQGSHKVLAPTFSTFQPMDMAQRSCQGLGLLPESTHQTLRAGEPQPSSRALAAARTLASPPALGAASVPGNTEKAEEVSEEGSLSLQTKIRTWFWKTQAHSLLQCGAVPPWFHGFITRREAERLLEPQPQGRYLVRFSESAVTFVLTYRSQACCRHFLLAQLTDGRHVVLGENSAHARLQDLLRHYTVRPLSPYRETLTQPLARQAPPPRSKPPIPAKPALPAEVYARPAPRSRLTLPPRPAPPIYHEPEEPIAFYAMGWGSLAEAPGHLYAELDGSEACGQNPDSPQLRPDNSVPGQGPPLPQKPPAPWRHTFPPNLSRNVLQDRGQAWLPLGPPQ